MPPPTAKPRVMVDADVLLAACASPTQHGASLVILRLAEATLVDAYASEQVITEVERNLTARLPRALSIFESIVGRSLRLVADPAPEQVAQYAGCAHEEDLPILVAAVLAGCRWLVSFNVRHFRPGCAQVEVVRPGELVRRIRDVLSSMGPARDA
jgi:predicted nucleic acid-binding protein